MIVVADTPPINYLILIDHADLILIDEQDARREAEERHFAVVGTLGILRDAARLNLIDLCDTIERLRSTSFYVAPALVSRLLRDNEK